ncbi:hypothetical protein QBC33DRAFT_517854 [Phialemonium atrogriseum]|uniref:Uncharacterized protein n=1 Tax=Phialemonium atrogriseum TaxID=1093897 RepID=A0AAJ0BTY3_9PEZI|nr:uncharacterized protein QBC33DRAFT_517854 [Phialemonium atrogriseum]KAK1764230.1 hypothetical protein QBC33DRAFT_517854 [Phialemonium atrogriseum]
MSRATEQEYQPGQNVCWLCDLRIISSERANACEYIARTEARRLGFPCVAIRRVNHNTVPADPHLTVFIGESLENVQLQGHIYIIEGPGRVPLRIARPHERCIIRDGSRQTGTEYWGFNGSCGYKTR